MPTLADPAARRPNLVVIDCHDLGKHLGCYGFSSVPSDHLDALAADGVRFERAFCTAPQCSPSRAALYTGRHAHAVGMLGLAHPPFDWRLHDGTLHLAEMLRRHGYTTHHVGLQHVVRPGDARVLELGFDSHEAPHAAAPVVADAAVARVRNAQAPYFLNVGFEEPHRDARGRFHAHPPFAERGVDLPPWVPRIDEAVTEFAELQGAIRALDLAVGRILAAIQDRSDAADTWVVFTTDHGLAMPRAKASMYDPGVEVALLMRWPAAGLVGGRTVPELASLIDLAPTLLEGLGLPLPDGLHGRSLWSRLQGGEVSASEPTAVFAEKTFHTAYEPQRAVRTERYKLIANLEVDILNVPADVLRSPVTARMADLIAQERPPLELYDLQDDPLEQVNRIDDPTLAEVAAALKERLVAWMRETGDPILAGPIASPYRHAAFRALGLPAEPPPYPEDVP